MTTVRIGDGVEFDDLTQALQACCGSSRWVAAMSARLPLRHMDELHAAADDCFSDLGEDDWLEAFSHHPRIGDVEQLRERFAGSGALSEDEQAGIGGADDEVLAAIARGNAEYEERFGFVYLVRASGRTAPELLEILERRLGNERDVELVAASIQQREITHLRLAATFLADPATVD